MLRYILYLIRWHIPAQELQIPVARDTCLRPERRTLTGIAQRPCGGVHHVAPVCLSLAKHAFQTIALWLFVLKYSVFYTRQLIEFGSGFACRQILFSANYALSGIVTAPPPPAMNFSGKICRKQKGLRFFV